MDLVRRWQAQWLCCPRSSNRPAPPERRTTLVGQPVGEEVIAKKENKIQIFRSHNCILGLGLDPVVAESSKPAHPGLGPGPRSPGRSPRAAAPHAGSGTAERLRLGSGGRRERPRAPVQARRGGRRGGPQASPCPPPCPPVCPRCYRMSERSGTPGLPRTAWRIPSSHAGRWVEASLPAHPRAGRGADGVAVNQQPTKPRHEPGCGLMLQQGASRAATPQPSIS